LVDAQKAFINAAIIPGSGYIISSRLHSGTVVGRITPSQITPGCFPFSKLPASHPFGSALAPFIVAHEASLPTEYAENFAESFLFIQYT